MSSGGAWGAGGGLPRGDPAARSALGSRARAAVELEDVLDDIIAPIYLRVLFDVVGSTGTSCTSSPSAPWPRPGTAGSRRNVRSEAAGEAVRRRFLCSRERCVNRFGLTVR
jgi:hypothetical protein